MTHTQPKQLAGRLWLTAMGLFLAAAGTVFTGVLWRAYERAAETRAWTEVPCTVVSSRIDSKRPSPNSNITHRVEIRYRYEFDGKPFTGSRIKKVDIPTTHEERARSRQERFPTGLETTCFVNPEAPDEVVLQHTTKAALYSIWFPLLFVVGGLGMAWTAWRK